MLSTSKSPGIQSIHILSLTKSPTQTLRSRINPHNVHLQITNTNTKDKKQSTFCPSPSHQQKHKGQESIHILSTSKSPTQTLRSRMSPHTVHLLVTNANTKDKNQSTSSPSPSHQLKHKGQESIHILSISKSPTQTLRSLIDPHPVHLQVIKAITKDKNQSTSCPSPSHQCKHYG